MALIEYDAYKQKLRDLGPELEKLSAALDMDGAQAEAALTIAVRQIAQRFFRYGRNERQG